MPTLHKQTHVVRSPKSTREFPVVAKFFYSQVRKIGHTLYEPVHTKAMGEKLKKDDDVKNPKPGYAHHHTWKGLALIMWPHKLITLKLLTNGVTYFLLAIRAT